MWPWLVPSDLHTKVFLCAQKCWLCAQKFLLCAQKFFSAPKSVWSAPKSFCSAPKSFALHPKVFKCPNSVILSWWNESKPCHGILFNWTRNQPCQSRYFPRQASRKQDYSNPLDDRDYTIIAQRQCKSAIAQNRNKSGLQNPKCETAKEG